MSVKLSHWAWPEQNLLQLAAGCERPCPSLDTLQLGTVSGALDLHQFPSLKQLELANSPVKLSASRPLSLTSLVMEGLPSTLLNQWASPVLACLGALRKLAIRDTNHADIDLDFVPCLTSLELDRVSSVMLLGSQPCPSITRLVGCATRAARNIALRELELPVVEVPEWEHLFWSLPALTALTCPASLDICEEACPELQHLCLCYGLSEDAEDADEYIYGSVGNRGDEPLYLSQVGICWRAPHSSLPTLRVRVASFVSERVQWAPIKVERLSICPAQSQPNQFANLTKPPAIHPHPLAGPAHRYKAHVHHV